jgi:signal transduction histidine kinase
LKGQENKMNVVEAPHRKKSEKRNPASYRQAMEQLASVAQELSRARNMKTLMDIVRRAARELTGSDGAAFVLREGESCLYAEEDAVNPLWRGQRFPIRTCLSGWVMQNRRIVIIEDVYADDRIPLDEYNSTFVKSLIMAPVRKSDPLGAIGSYWAKKSRPRPGAVKVLLALADIVSAAMENLELFIELETKARESFAELAGAKEELQEAKRQLGLLPSRILLSQEEERKRIAHELHDSIGASLGAIRFGLEGLLVQMERGAASPESIDDIISIVCNAGDDVRRICMNLRPPMLDDLGIIATIGWLTRKFQETYSHIHVEKVIRVEEEEITEAHKVVVFRVLQEAFHNIAKHSKADMVEVSLQKWSDTLELMIADNGIGFNVHDAYARRNGNEGMGLVGMRERVELSCGVFSIESDPGQGTAIRASWDCSKLV